MSSSNFYEPRDIYIPTRWSKTEAAQLKDEADKSGAANVSEYIRATALCRRDVEIARFDLQKLWGEAIKLSGRVAAAEPGKEQKAVLGEAKLFFTEAAKLIQRANRRYQ